MSDLSHAQLEQAWIAALASGRMPHAWLIAGPKGLGKGQFAERAARFLVADGDLRAGEGAANFDVPASHSALALIEAGGHPEYIVVRREVPESKRSKDGAAPKSEDLARNITIDQVRVLIRRLQLRPAVARWRAVVIDSIDDLERGAANALLKTLEEPPPNTVFLLVSHQPGRLLPTIRSRCRLLNFAPLTAEQSATWMAEHRPNTPPEARTTLIHIAGGSPGRMAALADADFPTFYRLMDDIARGGDRDNRLRAELSKTLAVKGEGGADRLAAAFTSAEAVANRYAHQSSGPARPAAIAAWRRIQDTARLAQSWSESPATLAYVIGDALSGLSKDHV